MSTDCRGCHSGPASCHAHTATSPAPAPGLGGCLVTSHCPLCHHGDLAALIVTGGLPEDAARSVEVLGEDGSAWCELPDLAAARTDHTQSGLIACGGYGGEVIR